MNYWNNINSVLFVAPKEWVSDSLGLKMLLDKTFNGLKIREVILITEENKKSDPQEEIKSITCFSPNDFNFIGTLKNEKVKEVMSISFDTLVICGTLTKKMSKVLLKSKYQRIIGLNSDNDYVEINLQTKSNEPSEMVNFAKNTLSKINS